MVKLMRGLVPKSVPNFTTSEPVVLGAAIDIKRRKKMYNNNNNKKR